MRSPFAISILLFVMFTVGCRDPQQPFDGEFASVRRAIPNGINSRCSAPQSSAYGLTATCEFDLQQSGADASARVEGAVPRTYSLVKQDGGGASYVHHFGNDSYYLKLEFVNAPSDGTHVTMTLSSTAS